MKLVDYDNTGFIGRVLTHPNIEEILPIPPFVIPGDPRAFERIEVADDLEVSYDKQYVSNQEVVDRPKWTPTVSGTSIPADGVTAITVSGIPASVKVDLFGPASDSWSGAAGDVSVAVGLPGAYTLLIDAFPYQLVEVKFNAT